MRAAGPVCRRKTAPRWGAWVQAVSERPLPAPHPSRWPVGSNPGAQVTERSRRKPPWAELRWVPCPLESALEGGHQGPTPRPSRGAPDPGTLLGLKPQKPLLRSQDVVGFEVGPPDPQPGFPPGVPQPDLQGQNTPTPYPCRGWGRGEVPMLTPPPLQSSPGLCLPGVETAKLLQTCPRPRKEEKAQVRETIFVDSYRPHLGG